MSLSPEDIQGKRFHDAFRGYNHEEVDLFLDEVAASFQALFQEVRAGRTRLSDLEAQLADVRGTEGMLKRTLLAAQRAADEAITDARAEAARLVAAAEAQSAATVDEARRQAEAIVAGAAARQVEAENLATQLRNLDAAHRTTLGAHLREQLRALETLPSPPGFPTGPLVFTPPEPAPPAPGGAPEARAEAPVPAPAAAPAPTGAMPPAIAPMPDIAVAEPAPSEVAEAAPDPSMEPEPPPVPEIATEPEPAPAGPPAPDPEAQASVDAILDEPEAPEEPEPAQAPPPPPTILRPVSSFSPWSRRAEDTDEAPNETPNESWGPPAAGGSPPPRRVLGDPPKLQPRSDEQRDEQGDGSGGDPDDKPGPSVRELFWGKD